MNETSYGCTSFDLKLEVRLYNNQEFNIHLREDMLRFHYRERSVNSVMRIIRNTQIHPMVKRKDYQR
jgi:hypothetical protein